MLTFRKRHLCRCGAIGGCPAGRGCIGKQVLQRRADAAQDGEGAAVARLRRLPFVDHDQRRPCERNHETPGCFTTLDTYMVKSRTGRVLGANAKSEHTMWCSTDSLLCCALADSCRTCGQQGGRKARLQQGLKEVVVEAAMRDL